MPAWISSTVQHHKRRRASLCHLHLTFVVLEVIMRGICMEREKCASYLNFRNCDCEKFKLPFKIPKYIGGCLQQEIEKKVLPRGSGNSLCSISKINRQRFFNKRVPQQQQSTSRHCQAAVATWEKSGLIATIVVHPPVNHPVRFLMKTNGVFSW